MTISADAASASVPALASVLPNFATVSTSACGPRRLQMMTLWPLARAQSAMPYATLPAPMNPISIGYSLLFVTMLPTRGALGIGEALPALRRNTYFAAVSAAFDNTPNRPKRLSSESLPAPKATT